MFRNNRLLFLLLFAGNFNEGRKGCDGGRQGLSGSGYRNQFQQEAPKSIMGRRTTGL